MGKGDKKAKDKGATVSHVNPFNSVDEEFDDEPSVVDQSVLASAGGKKKGKGGKGKKKKENAHGDETATTNGAVAEEEAEDSTECSNPALLADSPRANAAAGQASSEEEQGRVDEDQAAAEKGGKKGRMRAYLERKEEEFREQEKAKLAEAKKQAKALREKEAKKKTARTGTRVDNPFAVDESSDEEADGEQTAAEGGHSSAQSPNTSTFNPMQLDMAADDDDDERWLDTAMQSGSVQLDDGAVAAPDADKTFKVKQTAWKGKKVRGHRVKASVSLIVSQMSMRIMDGDVLVCNILYQDIIDWEVGTPIDKGGKPTIDISLEGGSPTFTALGPLVRFASKHAAAIAAQLTFSVTEFRELSGKAGYTPPASASGSFAATDSASSPATAEEGVPPEDPAGSGDDDSLPETVESLLSKVDETSKELEGLEDELEKRDDMIEDLRDKLGARDAAIATLQAQMAALKHENAALKASLTNSQAGGDAAADGFVAAATDDEVSVDSLFAAAREADAEGRNAEAVALYNGSLKTAFAHLSEHPELKPEWAAPLKIIALRAKELKQLAGLDYESLSEPMTPRTKIERAIGELPDALQTRFTDAVAAERAGETAKAAAEYQAGVKLSAGFLKEHPEMKTAIAPKLQGIVAHAKQLATH